MPRCHVTKPAPRYRKMAPVQCAMLATFGPHDARFINARRLVFGIALASFLLSFFHRTAPAAIAGELTRAFAINSAVLGTLAATYFYVYTLLQIPVGVLADTLGPRRILSAGSLIAGAGSLAVRAGADLGNRRGRPHAGGRRRVGRLHRNPQDERGLVPRQPLRHAQRRHDVRRQSRRGDRRRTARLGRHADVVAGDVRRPRRALDCTGRRQHGSSCATAPSRWASRRSTYEPRRAAAPSHWAQALGRVLANPATWPGFLRQRRHRRQLSRVRGAVGSAVSRRNVRNVTRQRGRAREPAAARALHSARCSSAAFPIDCEVAAG